MIYKGEEHFMINGVETEITITDFWKWSYSDFLNHTRQAALSCFLVSSSAGLSSSYPKEPAGTSNILLTPDGFRVAVSYASYLQSQDGDHPDHILFRIGTTSTTPAKYPDAYVFCLYKALSEKQNPLNLDLWDFFIIASKAIDKEILRRTMITLPLLQTLNAWKCGYREISEGIRKAMGA